MSHLDFIKNCSAVILAGGQGTRLRPVLADRQKAVAPMDGKPFLSFLLEKLYSCGIEQIILACGYKAESVRAALMDFPDLEFSVECEPLGTGGGLLQALRHSHQDHLLVMNGDSYLDFDLGEFLQWFAAKQCPAGMVLNKSVDSSRYGQVSLASDGLISSFVEKGQGVDTGWINAGIYCFRKDLFASLPWQGKFSLEKDLFPFLVAEQKLWGYPCEAYFIDIGTPESWRQAQTYFANKK
ncbi:MAG: nucleotidyltransferase family protein [Lentisphaeria bacterium]